MYAGHGVRYEGVLGCLLGSEVIQIKKELGNAG